MPKQISYNAANAFMLGKEFKSSNTVVTVDGDTAILTLFGNDIAFNEGGNIRITNADYKTNTTKDRLNAIDGVHVQQKQGVWYLNGNQWNGKLIKI